MFDPLPHLVTASLSISSRENEICEKRGEYIYHLSSEEVGEMCPLCCFSVGKQA